LTRTQNELFHRLELPSSDKHEIACILYDVNTSLLISSLLLQVSRENGGLTAATSEAPLNIHLKTVSPMNQQ
jgi:hypothetical protein